MTQIEDIEREVMASVAAAKRTLRHVERHWIKPAKTEQDYAEARDAFFASWRLNKQLAVLHQDAREATKGGGVL